MAKHKADITIYPKESVWFSEIPLGMLFSVASESQGMNCGETYGDVWIEHDLYSKTSKGRGVNLKTGNATNFNPKSMCVRAFLGRIYQPTTAIK